MSRIKILSLSGSLRPESYNHVLLKNIQSMISDQVDFEIFDGMGKIPLFDGVEQPSEAVNLFRKKLLEADGIIICSPEYAFGVPGAFKNALDWTVSSGEFVNKPVALITASSQGEKAHESLLHTLSAISAEVERDCTLLISFIRAKIKNGIIVDEATQLAVSALVNNFIGQVQKNKRAAEALLGN